MLKGKPALITGAGRGIGCAAAIALAKEGMNIGLLGKSMENLEVLASELEELGCQCCRGSGRYR